MANTRLYMEEVHGKSPSQAGFTVRGGGRSVRNYIIGNDGSGDASHTAIASTTELYTALVEFLGATNTHSDGKRLKRTLPLADPIYQWCMCESIGNIQGLGNPGAKLASNPFNILEAPTVDYYSLYPAYLLSSVTFTPRPYASLQDDSIGVGQVIWYDQEGNSVGGGGGIKLINYAKEWLRFTDVETVPMGEYITAQAGQFKFDVASGLSPDGKAAGNGQLRMLAKKKTVKMTWYCVPYAYLDTGSQARVSYIDQGIGCINQYDWFNFPKGSLLLEGVAVNRYTPVVPQSLVLSGSGGVSFANTKLCDITFLFSYQNPIIAKDVDDGGNQIFYGKDAGNGRATPRTSTNLNDIQAGWNLVPYAHQMGWYYAKTNIPGFPASDKRPLYPSFPFELLFTNPGVTV